jgi:putative alpha-1,2-mannosidase
MELILYSFDSKFIRIQRFLKHRDFICSLQRIILNFIKMFLLIFVSIVFGEESGKKQPVDYVNTFIGTGKYKGPSKWGFYGGTYPGATVPWGMVQISPETRTTGADRGYYYEDEEIYFFSFLNHWSGYPNGSSGDFKIKIICDKDEPGDASNSNHFDEFAAPGYYGVWLDNKKIFAEFTTTERCGFCRFTVQTQEDPIMEIFDVDSFYISNTNNLVGKTKTFYFFVELLNAIDKSHEFKNGVLINFPQSATSNWEILAKFGFSTVSVKGAQSNLNKEIPGWNFDQIKKQARNSWNKHLSKVEVSGGTENQRTIFYTALYHSLLLPHIYSDVDGRYTGTDDKIHKAEGFNYYQKFSPWDTFRCLHPLLTLIEPKRQQDMICSLLKIYEHSGWLPAKPMTGNHAIPIITDSYFKGIRDFDINIAYAAMKKSILAAPFIFKDMENYLELGYVPAELPESVTRTLEYAYDDWALAEFAKAINQTDDFKILAKRSLNYRNLFNPSERLMIARQNDGSWNRHGGYKEGDKWAYSWFVPHNVNDLINLMGGKKSFVEHLESTFIDGKYVHDNEPILSNAYLFNYAEAPWETQKWVRTIMSTNYTNEPGGIPGNDDLGSMSSWYVFGAMGIYPVCPGNPLYAIGSPIFDEAIIHLDNGKEFSVKTSKNSAGNKYIQSALLNGRPHNNTWIEHATILDGGELQFQMGAIPHVDWASTSMSAPPSITAESADFELGNSELSSYSVLANEPFITSAILENNGSLGTREIKIYVNDEYTLSEWIMLDHKVSTKINIALQLYEPGVHNIRIDKLTAMEIEVKSPLPPGETLFEFMNMKVNQIVPIHSPAELRATVKNIGSYQGATNAILNIDSKPMDSVIVELMPGESEQIFFTTSFFKNGFHTVSIAGLNPQKVKVYQVPLESKVLHLDFEENNAKITNDKSGFSNNAYLLGNFEWVQGKFGHAIKTGEKGFIEIPQHQSLDIARETISVLIWVYPINESGADFISKGDHIVLKMQNREQINFFAGGWGRGECLADVPENWNRNWHHLAGVCDVKSLKLYIDGELRQSVSISGEIEACPFPWNVGRNAEIPVGRSTNGFIDDVRIYVEPLSQDEIQKVISGNFREYSIK